MAIGRGAQRPGRHEDPTYFRFLYGSFSLERSYILVLWHKTKGCQKPFCSILVDAGRVWSFGVFQEAYGP